MQTMKWCTKLEWSFFIFTTLQCMCSGCYSTIHGCFIDAECSDGLNTNGMVIRNNEYNYKCRGESILLRDYNYYEGYYYPIRIKTDSNYIATNLLQKDNLAKLIVSLEITNGLAIETMIDLPGMKNLKALNYSNNNLHVAKLFNVNELIALENIDLSHNNISSIDVDGSQFVYKRLQNLNLSNNLLTNINGGVFEPFRYLEYLDLSHNKIVSIDHYTFEGLSNVKYLYISYNNISDINVSLFRFINLKELYLDNNNIENLSIQNFETLHNLQTLTLHFNKIKTIPKDTFSKTESLVLLKLHHNLINNIQKDAFLTTTSLKTIDLANNLIEYLPKDLFKNNNITSFSITANILKGSISKGMFEGLQLVTELDLSHQAITAIEDFTFLGMTKLTTLLLNNNEIKAISVHSFKTLIGLNKLDLSNNFITNIDFNKVELISLEFLDLNNNYIQQILHKDFQGLHALRFLDVSQNNITKLEPASFQTLEKIENLLLINNPISGTLSNNSFDGLPLVPSLDLSHTSITAIKNGSFNGMLQLQDLNISRSAVNKLEYGAFVNTGNIKSIDLSFNKLTEFHVDGNDLKKLTSLYLNNNAILQISKYAFKHMSMLNTIIISYNSIQTIDDKSFVDQSDLRCLDASFNNNYTFNASIINNIPTLETLLLSGVKNAIGFKYTGSTPVRKLELSLLGMRNISLLHINSMRHLNNLMLSNNNIERIDFSTLNNMSVLEWLDLSFNNISYIQPGTFKDNIVLHSLNLSHNSLTSLNYGSFRGLMTLNLLDISYNTIRDIGIERFYDTPKLKVLIADHNKISEVSSNFLTGHFKLDQLSIGHNPLLCENIIMLKQTGSLTVSALDTDENNSDSVDGIVCNAPSNNNKVPQERHMPNINTTISEQILIDIRDILFNSTENRASKMISDINHSDIKDSFDKLDKHVINQTNELQTTNSLLERALKVLLGFGKSLSKLNEDQGSKWTSNKENFTYYGPNTTIIGNTTLIGNTTHKGNQSQLDAIVSDVNQVKQELLYLENVITEVNKKISLVNSNRSNHDDVTDKNIEKSLIFVEVCISLILLMLICFFLYKFYEKKILKHRSFSTRTINDAMDNSNL